MFVCVLKTKSKATELFTFGSKGHFLRKGYDYVDAANELACRFFFTEEAMACSHADQKRKMDLQRETICKLQLQYLYLALLLLLEVVLVLVKIREKARIEALRVFKYLDIFVKTIGVMDSELALLGVFENFRAYLTLKKRRSEESLFKVAQEFK